MFKPKKFNGASFLPQDELIQRLKADFPEVFSEGNIDPKKLKATLGEHVDLGERYGLTWKGKNDVFRVIQETTTKTLKPAKDESVNFDETENLFIEGDNLEALKVLQRSYYGKVKMIYIDPPYNTGNDFVYNDSFAQNKSEYEEEANIRNEQGNIKQLSALQKNTKDSGHYHSNWLNMMYPRLYLARNLLRDDGVIFVSIDDNEVHNLRLIMNEIFGEENFIAQIIWEKRYGRSNDAKLFAYNTDYILLYRKSEALSVLREPRGESQNEIYSNPDNDPRGEWTSVSFVSQRTRAERPNLSYSIKHPKTGEQIDHPANSWKYSEEKYLQLQADNRLYWGKDGDQKYPRIKRFLSELAEGIVPVTLWNHEETGTGEVGTKEVESLVGKDVFDHPKPVSLLLRAINIGTSSDKNDVILDFFAGSATTAHAVMKANMQDGGNRKWIVVQLPEETDENSEARKAGYKSIADIAKERIKRAGKKLVEENSDKKLDTGFKVLKIDETNFKVWDANIKTPQQLEQQMIDSFDTIKQSATEEDLLLELVIKSGLEPTVKKGKQEDSYWRIGNGEILIYLKDNISEETFKAILGRKPKKVILLERALQDNDELKTNLLLQAEKENIEVLVI